MSVTAVKAALHARLAEFNARPDAANYPYTKVYVSAPTISSVSFGDERQLDSYYFQTTVVGVSEEQVNLLLDRVMKALRGFRPVIAGVTAWKVVNFDAQPTREDDDLPDRNLWIATNQWTVQAVNHPTPA